MSINPNTLFLAGQVLTSDQANRFPRGVMAFASSPTNYTLTASDALATGMTVTWSAVADRYYRITYYEPLVSTPAVSGGVTNLRIKDGATTLQYGSIRTNSATFTQGNVNVVLIATWATSATRTLTGQVSVSSTTGTPLLNRASAYPAFMLVEDIGPA
jgi:hypothetical protein